MSVSMTWQLSSRFVIVLLLFSFVACSSSDPAGDDPGPFDIPGWKLVWNDEFDQDDVEPDRWRFEVNADGGGNNELQYYTSRRKNAFLEDERLVIEAHEETYSDAGRTREYTSARMTTRGKGDWLYGRIDVRAKMPIGQGLWPAIWMMPTDSKYGGWAASGEIDIMEYLGHDANRVYGTLHYGATAPQNTSSGDSYVLPSGDFNASFHTFSLEWSEGVMKWFVDDFLYATQTQWFTAGQAFPAPFDKRFFLILNVAVGGNWPGSPNDTTVFPQRMEVEYVRVYTRDDS